MAHMTERADLALVVGYAGTGKSAMLGVARVDHPPLRWLFRTLHES